MHFRIRPAAPLLEEARTEEKRIAKETGAAVILDEEKRIAEETRAAVILDEEKRIAKETRAAVILAQEEKIAEIKRVLAEREQKEKAMHSNIASAAAKPAALPASADSQAEAEHVFKDLQHLFKTHAEFAAAVRLCKSSRELRPRASGSRTKNKRKQCQSGEAEPSHAPGDVQGSGVGIRTAGCDDELRSALQKQSTDDELPNVEVQVTGCHLVDNPDHWSKSILMSKRNKLPAVGCTDASQLVAPACCAAPFCAPPLAPPHQVAWTYLSADYNYWFPVVTAVNRFVCQAKEPTRGAPIVAQRCRKPNSCLRCAAQVQIEDGWEDPVEYKLAAAIIMARIKAFICSSPEDFQIYKQAIADHGGFGWLLFVAAALNEGSDKPISHFGVVALEPLASTAVIQNHQLGGYYVQRRWSDSMPAYEYLVSFDPGNALYYNWSDR